LEVDVRNSYKTGVAIQSAQCPKAAQQQYLSTKATTPFYSERLFTRTASITHRGSLQWVRENIYKNLSFWSIQVGAVAVVAPD
jgi:hypothetical protein